MVNQKEDPTSPFSQSLCPSHLKLNIRPGATPTVPSVQPLLPSSLPLPLPSIHSSQSFIHGFNVGEIRSTFSSSTNGEYAEEALGQAAGMWFHAIYQLISVWIAKEKNMESSYNKPDQDLYFYSGFVTLPHKFRKVVLTYFYCADP